MRGLIDLNHLKLQVSLATDHLLMLIDPDGSMPRIRRSNVPQRHKYREKCSTCIDGRPIATVE
jgi:hypothetical protein